LSPTLSKSLNFNSSTETLPSSSTGIFFPLYMIYFILIEFLFSCAD
jgi:hypothetical protein